jgi:hypothetical protein
MVLSRWDTGSVPREQSPHLRSYPRGAGDIQPAPRGASVGYDLAVRSKSRYSAASSGLANMIVLSSRWIIRP